MPQIRGFSLGAVALAIAATAMFAAVASTSAQARTERQHQARHFTAQRAHVANDHRYRAYRAYGAMPGGGSGFASPSYPGFGYGYGDNSHSYTN